MKNIIISLLFAFAFLSLQGCTEKTTTQAKATTHNEAGMGVGKCGTSLKHGGIKCGTGKCGSAEAASGQ